MLLRYDAIAHEQLPNEIALLSGQGPTAQTAANCPTFSPLTPGSSGARRTGAGRRLRLPLVGEDAAGSARSRAPDLARVRGRARRSAGQPAPCSHPAAGAADPSVCRRPVRDLSESVRLLRSDHPAPPPARRAMSAISQLKPDLDRLGGERARPLLHRPRPLPRRQRRALLARRPGGTGARGELAGRRRALDPRLEGLQAGRPARDHERRGALDGRIRRLELLLRPAVLSRTTPRPNSTTGEATSARCCSRRSSRAARAARIPTTTSRCCARSRTSSACSHLGYAALPAVKSFSPSLLNAPAKG